MAHVQQHQQRVNNVGDRFVSTSRLCSSVHCIRSPGPVNQCRALQLVCGIAGQPVLKGTSAFKQAAAVVPVGCISNGDSYEQSFEDDLVGLLTDEVVCLKSEAQRLEELKSELQQGGDVAHKIQILRQQESYLAFLAMTKWHPFWEAVAKLPVDEQYVLLCLPAIRQQHVVLVAPEGQTYEGALGRLAKQLLRVEHFYDSMGGVVGYQLKSLQLILAADKEYKQEGMPAEEQGVSYHVPPGIDLSGEEGHQVGTMAAARGLLSLPQVSEVYPVGGAGDRLGLRCEVSGESLPAAMLPYCGRPMMEGLVRDLQAREYLYYQLTGQQVITPVAIMTSDAKGNHRRITSLMEENNWFGRGKDAFRLFRQPLVPVLSAETGRWLLSAPLKVMMKPGGHGAIWKLMHDDGVFDWLAAKQRHAALVRQISNPMAGVDTTLLALAGTGLSGDYSFGFMSCERTVGAAEGMNVLQSRKRWREGEDGQGMWVSEYGITNVEYTEFERLGINDQASDCGSGHSVFPANTNILYVGLDRAHEKVKEGMRQGCGAELPGVVFNLKKKVEYRDPLTGKVEVVRAGRMECTMQNLADEFVTELPTSTNTVEPHELSTFLVYNMRRKVTSSAKKRRDPTSLRVAQTPDGSFYDLMRNAWQILQRCGMRHVPEVGSVEQYLSRGPGFIFLFHPALGPLWDVIAQKISGGALMQGSELVLEVAEARIENVHIDGSFLVYAHNVLGTCQAVDSLDDSLDVWGLNGKRSFRTWEGAMMKKSGLGGDSAQGVAGGSRAPVLYSSGCGRIHLTNVTIENIGVDWHHPGNLYWRHRIHRHECCVVELQGRSEFEAYDVCIQGQQKFVVPDGYRMLVTQGAGGRGLLQWLIPLEGSQPSWEWSYRMENDGRVALRYVRNTSVEINEREGRAIGRVGAVQDMMLDYVI